MPERPRTISGHAGQPSGSWGPYRSIRAFASLLLVAVVAAVSSPLRAQGLDPAPWVGQSLDGLRCTGRATGYGPYDYTNPAHRAHSLAKVEGAHFNANVESMRGGAKPNHSFIGDLEYTLSAFPNHHRALYTRIRLEFKEDRRKKTLGSPPPECWLQRAARFAPHDGTVPLLYGLYLHRRGMHEKALAKYDEAESMLEVSGELFYNKGLLLFEMRRYEDARAYADKARSAGYPLPALNQKLSAAGY